MVSTGISEFTFGYGFLYEQTQANWTNLRAAPILPSLQQEKDEGWDARLPLKGTDFYYQFKLSDYLFNGNAKFIRDGTYKNPYYRISLHKRDFNRQHNTLVKHSKKHPNTFYVAPEFSGIDRFNRAFLSRQLMQNSRLIPLNVCHEEPNPDQHYITFQPGNPSWQLHSEPKAYDNSYTGDDLEKLFRESSSEWRDIDVEFAKDIFDSVSERVTDTDVDVSVQLANEELLDLEVQNRHRNGYLRRSSELLSLNFGISLVIVGSPEEDQNNEKIIQQQS